LASQDCLRSSPRAIGRWTHPKKKPEPRRAIWIKSEESDETEESEESDGEEDSESTGNWLDEIDDVE